MLSSSCAGGGGPTGEVYQRVLLLSADLTPPRMWVTKEEFEEDGYSILSGPLLDFACPLHLLVPELVRSYAKKCPSSPSASPLQNEVYNPLYNSSFHFTFHVLFHLIFHSWE